MRSKQELPVIWLCFGLRKLQSVSLSQLFPFVLYNNTNLHNTSQQTTLIG